MLKRTDIEDLKREFAGDHGKASAAPQDDTPFPEGPEDYGLSRDSEPNHMPATPPPPSSLNEWNAGKRLGKPPPREWLLGNQFCRGFLSGVQAPGATGKSAVRMLQYLSLATNRPLSGEHIFKRARVLLLSLEDDDDELRRRLEAAQMHYDISPSELDGWLFCATPKGIKLAEIKDGSRQAGQLDVMLREAIDRLQIDMVALDPFIKLHALEENDNGAMDFVCDLLVKLAIEKKIAIDAPHHTKKGLQVAGDPDAGRGASSARDAGRLIYTLTRMSDQEGETFGIPAEERRLYVRLDSGKVNIAPPSGKATWFKLLGVRLENGNTEYPSGDEVQTVVRWHPPETWGTLSAAQLNAALDEIEAGLANGQRYSDAGPATSRAAWRVVQHHCPDRTEPQCREIVRTWVKNGVLVNEDYDDPIERKPRKGLRVCNEKRPT
jgi:AAA domain